MTLLFPINYLYLKYTMSCKTHYTTLASTLLSPYIYCVSVVIVLIYNLEASKLKSVNFILNINWVNSLRLGGIHLLLTFRVKSCNKRRTWRSSHFSSRSCIPTRPSIESPWAEPFIWKKVIINTLTKESIHYTIRLTLFIAKYIVMSLYKG